jgi:hypothetical protein
MDNLIYNWATQEISGISLAEQGYNSKTLRNAPPLGNYKEVNWEKLYLDTDLELYFVQSKLHDINQKCPKKGT